MSSSKPRVGVSACLLGRQVRFDGGHKRAPFVCDTLAPYVELVPVCPEVEVGMPVPRETLRLAGEAARPRMIGNRTGTDHTDAMLAWAARRAEELAAKDLDGYVLKKDSPSCGLERVKVYARPDTSPTRDGTGLFAAALRARMPELALTEEGRLCDPVLRASFLEQLFARRRLKQALAEKPGPATLIRMHAAHKLLYMAHSPEGQRTLGRMVAGAGSVPELEVAYTRTAMQTLAVPATRGKHTNVLHHALGFFKRVLTRPEKAELVELIDEYRRGVQVLAVPLTLLAHHLRRHGLQGWIAEQVYFEPFPHAIAAR